MFWINQIYLPATPAISHSQIILLKSSKCRGHLQFKRQPVKWCSRQILLLWKRLRNVKLRAGKNRVIASQDHCHFFSWLWPRVIGQTSLSSHLYGLHILLALLIAIFDQKREKSRLWIQASHIVTYKKYELGNSGYVHLFLLCFWFSALCLWGSFLKMILHL